MAYYAHLSPGTNVGQQPTDYADVNNSTYIDWAVPVPVRIISSIARTRGIS